MIRAGVPADWVVGDKTGRGKTQTNDIAIVRAPGQPPFLIVIFGRDLYGTPEHRDHKIAEIAREVLPDLKAP